MMDKWKGDHANSIFVRFFFGFFNPAFQGGLARQLSNLVLSHIDDLKGKM